MKIDNPPRVGLTIDLLLVKNGLSRRLNFCATLMLIGSNKKVIRNEIPDTISKDESSLITSSTFENNVCKCFKEISDIGHKWRLSVGI